MRLFLIFSLILPCICIKAQMNRTIYDERKNQMILYGECDANAFKNTEFTKWYITEHDNYSVNNKIIENCNLQIDSVLVFLSTWCEDSRREVPRFCKVMEDNNFKNIKIRFFCLDGAKQTDVIDTQKYEINYVPTFIFYNKGLEIYKIIETPNESFENDLLNISVSKK